MRDEMPAKDPNERCPSEFEGFDVKFAVSHPVKRYDRADQAMWSESRWSNVALLFFGLGALTCFYIVPFLFREAILEEADWVPLLLMGGVLAVLILPILALVGAGLTHRPRLIIDKYNRQLIGRNALARKPRVRVDFDDIVEFGMTTVLSSHDGDVGVFRVLYAELKDGRFASIATDSSPDLLRDLSGVLGRAPRQV